MKFIGTYSYYIYHIHIHSYESYHWEKYSLILLWVYFVFMQRHTIPTCLTSVLSFHYWQKLYFIYLFLPQNIENIVIPLPSPCRMTCFVSSSQHVNYILSKSLGLRNQSSFSSNIIFMTNPLKLKFPCARWSEKFSKMK